MTLKSARVEGARATVVRVRRKNLWARAYRRDLGQLAAARRRRSRAGTLLLLLLEGEPGLDSRATLLVGDWWAMPVGRVVEAGRGEGRH